MEACEIFRPWRRDRPPDDIQLYQLSRATTEHRCRRAGAEQEWCAKQWEKRRALRGRENANAV